MTSMDTKQNMEACNAVEREVDKVITKFTGISEHADRILRELSNSLESLKKEFDECPSGHELTPGQIIIMKHTVNKVRETVQRLATDHRELHSTVSKVGKAIDRNFVADFTTTSKDEVFTSAGKIDFLNQVICQHFYRQGMLDIAVELAREAGIPAEEGSREPFTELNRILDSLRQHQLGPALEWAQSRREQLEEHNSTLEFKLHRLYFIGLLQGGVENQAEAVKYARTHFHQFVRRHETEIQNLMGMFLFLPQGLASSPYHYLLDPTLWAEIYEIFTKDACALLGLSVDSPLSVSINSGCTALPALLNIKQVMLQRQVTGIWNGKDELPIEIDLGQDNRYHSVFACPILRQQSSDSNPPMRLICGHVISRDALTKLTSGNKLKCPYCPVEQVPCDARLVYF